MVQVTRHPTAEAFLAIAQPMLMRAEAENNLILGVAGGLARNPAAVANPYMATVSNGADVLACAVHIAPFKLLLSRAEREPLAALVRDAFAAIPGVAGITGPDPCAGEFAGMWSTLSGVTPRISMRMRIHETRSVAGTEWRARTGALRAATSDDVPALTAWTDGFVMEARIQEPVDAGALVADGIRRGRLFVWDDRGPKSMAAWAGKTPNGVRIHFVYTPPELRRQGYATACVGALTQHQLEQGSAFCWLYTDLSSEAPRSLFTRIGYKPVSDVAEFYLS